MLKPITAAVYPPSSNFILLGEDDIDDEELLKEVFTAIDNSLSLQFVNNGRSVINTLEKMDDNHLPSLIILDYNMPALNGAEILLELKRSHRYTHIPKVIWSTSASNTYKKSCLEAGAIDYVIKPSNMESLTGVVRRMLAFRALSEK